jgi:hypothetical protein
VTADTTNDLFDFDNRRLRHNDGLKTELSALAKVTPHLSSIRNRIVADIQAAGTEGLTPDEWSERNHALINTVRRRFTDLWKDGFIQHHPLEFTRKNSAKHDCVIWVSGCDPHRASTKRHCPHCNGVI